MLVCLFVVIVVLVLVVVILLVVVVLLVVLVFVLVVVLPNRAIRRRGRFADFNECFISELYPP